MSRFQTGAWVWLTDRLPERVLRTFDRVPVVIHDPQGPLAG